MQNNELNNNEFNSKHLDITLKKEVPEDNGIVIPLAQIFRCLRRFLLVWIAVSVLVALLVSAGTAAFSHQLSAAPVSLIGFNYDGAEKGLTPNGEKLDVNTIKNPAVIEAALTQLDYSLNNVDSVRNAIKIDSIIPAEAADEIALYKSAFEKNGNLTAAQAMLNVEYFPVQYKVTFDFSKTTFGDEEAAQVLNTILECYRNYFFEEYGYSNSIGNASLVVDYSDYDYLVAVDTYADTLSSLSDTVDSLKYIDFRSTQTGFSFSDLSNEISITKSYDADTLIAYILENSVVKDKQSMVSYYEYRMDELKRQKAAAVSSLETIEASIENYEKDSVIVHGGFEDAESASYTTISEKYDELFEQKIEAQNSVSYYTQRISECQERLNAVKKLSESSANEKHAAYVEERIAVLDENVKQLVDDVNATIMEYRESVTFANAYSVLVPANVLSTSYVSMLMSNVMKPLLFAEAAIFVLYLGVSVVYGFVIDSRRRKAEDSSFEN